MFCPQCGQQQASGEVRFCSRCGFQLEGVALLLANRGAPAAGGFTPAGAPAPPSPRRLGARQGGKLVLFGIFLMPVLAILHELIGTPEELPLVGLIFFMAGLLRLIYALIFEDGPLRQPKHFAPVHYAPPAAPHLPAHARGPAELAGGQGAPARAYVPPRPDTAEINYRPSVTESTTRLLDEERDRPAR